MANIPLTKYPQNVGSLTPGVILSVAIAVFALWLGQQPSVSNSGLGALTLAIITGIIAGNTFYPYIYRHCGHGVLFSKQILLRAGIILYGFRLTFQQILNVGVSGVLIDLLTLSSTFMLACWLGRRLLGMDRDTAWLIGAGSSICGAAAVLATEPVIKAESAKVAVAVATVVIFGTLGIFLYPLMWREFAHSIPTITMAQYGIYTGSTMHEVAQVVAASHAISPETENSAVIAKMLRVMMLAPFLMLLSMRVRQGETSRNKHLQPITFPWFALAFVLVALFNSFHLLTPILSEKIAKIDNLLLAMAMVALGLTTHVSQLREAGLRPLLLGLMLFIWLIVGGGVINLLVMHFSREVLTV